MREMSLKNMIAEKIVTDDVDDERQTQAET